MKNYYRNITGVEGKPIGGNIASEGMVNKNKAGPKKMAGIESIEGSIEKPRYRPGELAIIKKKHQEKRKSSKILGDHVDVEVRTGNKETR